MDEHDRLLNLVARMLTCATYITSHIEEQPFPDPVARDACSLLIEAAAALERHAPPPDLGKPMDRIEPAPLANGFTDPGVSAQRERYRSAHACPKCDSRATKTVKRNGRTINLICPACSASWEWTPVGEAQWI
jgi:hypothetical protein